MEKNLEMLMHKMDTWAQGVREETSSEQTKTDKRTKPVEMETT